MEDERDELIRTIDAVNAIKPTWAKISEPLATALKEAITCIYANKFYEGNTSSNNNNSTAHWPHGGIVASRTDYYQNLSSSSSTAPMPAPLMKKK